uniref:Uncharacterized protein n=1 Tax=viral metagenome TaxID=1070528 RepID=A0A6M3KLR3_9ZZZZ
MPWDIKRDDGKYLVVESDTGKIVGTHDTEEDARKQLAALNINVRHSILLAFEPFATMEYGKPIKLLPMGTFYRGKRVLDLTRDRLQAMLDNFKRGLPRYRVGINLNHKEETGKVGDILDLGLLEDGLYATRYELSDRGRTAVEEEGYDAASAEVVWSLNGSTYQDPETGKEYDNVLVGAALTPRPFFGHKHVALFSADADAEVYDGGDVEEFKGGYLVVEEDGTEHLPVIGDDGKPDRRLMGAAWAALHGGYRGNKYEGPKKQEAIRKLKALYKRLGATPPGEGESSDKEAAMAEDVQKAEEFAAKLQEKDAEIERLTAEAAAAAEKLTAASEKLTVVEAERAAEKRSKRVEELKAEALAYESISLDTDRYVASILSLEEKAPDEASWVKEQFAALDKIAKAAGVTREIGSDREGEDQPPAEQFITLVSAMVTEKFGGDQSKWSEAMAVVGASHPQLAEAYAAAVR